MRELTPRESDFVRMAEQLFAFVRGRESSNVEIESDIEGVLVRFMGRSTALELRLESDRALFVDIVPLRHGELPPRFDDRGSERLTRFSLSQLITEIDPSWPRPQELDDVTTADDLIDILRRFATGLEEHRDRILSADSELFGRVEAGMRRRLALIMLENWARFVDRVRRGFTGNIAEYTLAITERGQLEDVLQTWRGDSSEDPRAQLARLDRIFDDLTELVPAPDPGGPFSIVPDPKAKRWWRRPKVLTGQLREYFSARA